MIASDCVLFCLNKRVLTVDFRPLCLPVQQLEAWSFPISTFAGVCQSLLCEFMDQRPNTCQHKIFTHYCEVSRPDKALTFTPFGTWAQQAHHNSCKRTVISPRHRSLSRRSVGTISKDGAFTECGANSGIVSRTSHVSVYPRETLYSYT
jgi:hypothetical protein